ncbi:MAG: type II secretion system F family protein [Acidimicrobiales bacterium]
MSRALAIIGLTTFTGSALLLSELRWFRRPSLVERLSPFAPVHARRSRLGLLSAASFRDIIAPLSNSVGERIARLFGVNEEVGLRLRRIHSPLDVTTFRVRQAGWAAASFAAGLAVSATLGVPAALAVFVTLGAPTLTFLLLEQQVASASAAWQRRIFVELPVVAEQLGMLISAGWSLGTALSRVSERGTGVCAADLARVVQRVGQGLSEADALREWADIASVVELDRLVSVLSLNREAADLGRLITDEARSIRREAQRELIETIERRNQQVWIPVTVSALVPGVLLMGVPFIDALNLFSG